MNTVTVNTSKAYSVYIGNGLLEQVGKYAAALGSPGKAAIISESNVWPLYGDSVKKSLTEYGFEVFEYIFAAGEKSKNVHTYVDVLEFLAKNHITRSDFVLALGGGVTGDLTGFAAATYLRGIRYIQLPTTLLAMVDSSVGGKTAVDLSYGKNLAGAFHQPSLVLCDISALDTLPRDVFRDGCAEIIKYGVLYDPQLFAHLKAHGLSFDREYVVSRCISLKRDTVVADEFDRGERQKLNLGHTIGHAVEAKSDFRISHGQGVAIGMAMIARAGAKHGFCDQNVADDICSVISRFDLPTSTDFTACCICDAALSDKKRFGNKINLIVPEIIGRCTMIPYPVERLESLIEAGL